MAISIKDIVKLNDSKCFIKLGGVDEIRVNEFEKNGPIVGIIHTQNSTDEVKQNTYIQLEHILNAKIIRQSN